MCLIDKEMGRQTRVYLSRPGDCRLMQMYHAPYPMQMTWMSLMSLKGVIDDIYDMAGIHVMPKSIRCAIKG